MAYDDEQKKQALENKENRAIAFEVIEELRLLTGLSVRKLITHINAARGKVKSTDYETVYDFDPRSRSALYRETKKEQTKKVNDLKVASQKQDEGQLRIRIIEIPIYYGKNPEKRCELKEIEGYEILRWLFCYEVKTGYLSYINIPLKKYPPTHNLIMNYVQSVQTKLEIPFNEVIFTQKLLDHNSVGKKLCWDWVNSSVMETSWLTSDYQKLTNIEQLDCPARKHTFSLNGLEEKTKFIRTIRRLVNCYKSNIKSAQKKKQEKSKAAYENFLNEMKSATLKNDSDLFMKVIRAERSTGEFKIQFDSIISDKKFKKLKERIENEITQKSEAKLIAIQNLVKKHSVVKNETDD